MFLKSAKHSFSASLTSQSSHELTLRMHLLMSILVSFCFFWVTKIALSFLLFFAKSNITARKIKTIYEYNPILYFFDCLGGTFLIIVYISASHK